MAGAMTPVISAHGHTISPAMLPEEISSPHRMLNFIVSIILGLIISIFALLVRYFIKRPSEGEDRG